MSSSALARRRALVHRFCLLSALAASSVAHAQTKPAPDGAAEDVAAEDFAPEASAPEEPAPEEPAAEEPAPPSEASEDEALLEAEAEEVERAPAKGQGAIHGVVTDTKYDEPVIDAQIEVIGQKKKAYTDENGRFRLELPPGTYQIRVSYELYRASRIDGVEVKAGKLTQIDAKLVPDESAVEEYVVEEDAERSQVEGQNLERKRSAAVGDGVGRAEIARTPDRNAAEAAQRLVGATIVGGRFVFVRGLGERYTNALLNDAPLPSPEPDRQTVPLDLFPSLVMDSFSIVKQFTPDVPGDFAGGSVRIQTRDFPPQTLLQLSLNGGYNTEATFRKRLAYPGSNTDWLGFDSGLRSPPRGLPRRLLDGSGADPEERAFWGRAMNSWMSTRRRTSPPNYGLSLVAGDGLKIGPEQKLGLLGALNYGQSFTRRSFEFQRHLAEFLPDGRRGPVLTDFGNGEEGISSVRWGAFGSVSLELSREHRLNLTGFHSQSADDRTVDIEYFDRVLDGVFRGIHLEYTSRALNFGQLRGNHVFPSLERAELDWHIALANASRAQPDTRDSFWEKLTPNTELSDFAFAPAANSGSHFFSEQSEDSRGFGLDLMLPFNAKQSSRAKAGTLLSMRDREFSARRFHLERVTRPPGPPPAGFEEALICRGGWDGRCPDQLFRAQYIDPSALNLTEDTLRFDEYNAGLDVYAGYGLIDMQVMSRIRALAGARVEVTRQSFEGYSPFERETTTVRAKIDSTDVLPAFSLVFSGTERNNTRLGISRTLARPQLREFAPFFATSSFADLPVQGNENLKLTHITNVDLRFEYFPTLREVLAFSVFYKLFTDPIEEIIQPSSGRGIITYRNADSADLIGVEFEARQSLETFSPTLKEFTALANLTLVRSKVDLGENTGVATNPSRPLSLQSPYIVNLSLDYSNPRTKTDVRVLYNALGPRITAVGTQGVPDTYELTRHTVDATIAQKFADHFELKLSGTNLLRSDVVFAYRDATVYDRDSFQPEKDPVVRRFPIGTTYTLTGTYTY